MSGATGTALRVQLFGESHGPAVGVTLDGVPAGLPLDEKAMRALLLRRRGGDALTTPRRESDEPRILCGLRDGVTTGTPLTAIFENQNTHPQDYAFLPDRPRPGHADYPAWVKSAGYEDLSGGGYHSGRLTLPYVFAGGVAKQVLQKAGITMEAARLSPSDAQIEAAGAQGDSLGGVVECVARGVPAGLGEPFFDGVESVMAARLFAIPGVKAVEFGTGFAAATMLGSRYNDPYTVREGRVTCVKNDAGGLLGGLTTGMPVVVRCAFRPTASIAQRQNTVSLGRMENAELTVSGRHDPCIAVRGAVVVEAAAALALCELWLLRRGSAPL